MDYCGEDGKGFLVIVESPSKCAKIEQYLGSGYKVIASKGHITQIDGLKSIDCKHEYRVAFTLAPSKKSHIHSMRETIDQYLHDRIIIATDNDREGEAIGFHICAVFKLPVETTKRIIFNEITKSAIQEAIRHPTTLKMSIIQSQHARQILDIFIGFKISPMLWKYIFHSKSKSLSAGRCQTPALRLVYENYLTSLSVKQSTSITYKTTGHFFPPYNLLFELKNEFDTESDARTFLEASDTFAHTFVLFDKEIVTKSPPEPLNTSRLLQVASNILHTSPKVTMQLAQKLYQEGHITYMRTESKKYAQTFLVTAHKYISEKITPLASYLGNTANISNEGMQLPHEAIRVTHIDISHLTTDQPQLNSLYHFIWKNTVESCMAPATYHSHKIEMQGAMNQRFVHRLEVPFFLGWKKLEMSDADVTSIQSKMSGLLFYLLSHKFQSVVPWTYMESIAGIRGLHSHYTESSLIQKLEDHGIGRPSTYAMFVETIQERGYVKKQDIEGTKTQCTNFMLKVDSHCVETRTVEKVFGNERGKLVIQPLGILCIEFLIKNFGHLFDYSYTKYVEEELDAIACEKLDEGDTRNGVTGSVWSGGCKPWYTICEKTRMDIYNMTKELTTLQKLVYPIDTIHDLVFQEYGPCIRRHGCENDQGIMDEDAIEFLPIKKSVKIDLEKMKQMVYRIDDLIVYKQSYLGKYQNMGVFLRTGPYGHYVEWNSIKTAVSMDEELVRDITLDMAIELIDSKTKAKTVSVVENPEAGNVVEASCIVRPLNDCMSVRNGKYGHYVFYKTPTMKNPQFLNLKKFPENPLTCDLETILSWAMTESCKPKRTGKPFYRKKKEI